MSSVQISERVLKVANLVSRFTQDEMAQLLDLVPALQEMKPTLAQVEDDEIIAYFRHLAMEMSGGATPSPQDEFLFGLTYEEYFNLSEREAAALWDKAYAEEIARLDHEPEHEVRSNAHVPLDKHICEGGNQQGRREEAS